MPADPLPEQRWVRPFSHAPGHWKQQLPGKTLALAVKGDLAGLERLLADQPAALNQRGPHGRTLLWEAARRGHTAAVAWLLARGAAVDTLGAYNTESLVRLTPYVAARYYRRPATAAVLLAAGAQLDIFRAACVGEAARVAALLAADPALLNADDPDDEIYYFPPLSFAVAGGQAAMAADLIARGADVTHYSAQQLFLAAEQNRTDLVTLLLDHGADARTVEGHIFQKVDDLDLLRLLVARGTSVNRVSANSFPPLVYVARGDKGEHPEKVRLLLDLGAGVNAAGGPQARTALHYAAAVGHAQVVAVLLAAGADVTRRDADGLTARDLAAARGRAVDGL